MLFDKILGNSDIKNISWKNEIEKWLLYINNKGELNRFLPRLTKIDSRKINEVLAEISSAYLLESILNLKVTGWDIRKAQGKYKKNEVRFFGHWKNIRYAIKKAYPKFLSNCKNLVIINDDLFVGILDFPTDTAIKIGLFNNGIAYGATKGIFINRDYENIGGVLFININPTSRKKIYKYKFFTNPNALKSYNLNDNVASN